MTTPRNTLLLVIDVQNDFCRGGTLPAQETDSLIAPLNQYIEAAVTEGIMIAFSKDWHKSTHHSFKENGGIWEAHCVANTQGAAFHPKLYLPSVHTIILKGTDDQVEGYSAFEHTGLKKFLHHYRIKNIILCGVATSFCVLKTAIDSKNFGFDTTIVEALTRDITTNKDEIRRTKELIEKSGIVLV